jgi:hypothetical protein
MQPTTTYPVRFSVDYPDRPLNRVTTAFRIFVVIPIAFVLGRGVGRNVAVDVRWQDLRSSGGSRRSAGPRSAADDPVSAEVPALVVRLEP